MGQLLPEPGGDTGEDVSHPGHLWGRVFFLGAPVPELPICCLENRDQNLHIDFSLFLINA